MSFLEELQQENASISDIQKILCQHFLNKTELARQLIEEFNASIVDEICGVPHRQIDRTSIYHTEHELDSQFTIVLSLGVIAFVLGMFCNISLLLVIRNSRKFLKPAWMYVGNLAVADILTLISLVGFLLYSYFEPTSWPQRVHTYLFPSLDIFLATISMLSVTSIAVERALSMIMWKPGKLKVWSTKYVITSIWAYSFCMLVFASARMDVEENKLLNSAVFWLASGVALFGCLAITVVCYTCVIIFYLKRRKCDHRVLSSSALFYLLKDESEMTRMKSEKLLKKALIFLVVPLPFIAGWSFVLGIQTYEFMTGKIFNDARLNEAIIIVPWVVSAVNPILYACLTKELRSKLYKAYFGYFVTSQKNCSRNSSEFNESLV